MSELTKRIRMEKYLLLFVCLALSLFTFVIRPNAAEESETVSGNTVSGNQTSLAVSITRADGISVMIKEGEVYDTNAPLTFQIVEAEEGAVCEYSISGDGGQTYSDWTKMEADGYTLLPDVSNTCRGVWYVRFKKTLSSTEESISQNEVVSTESRVYQISFDLEAPVPVLQTEQGFAQWSKTDIRCLLTVEEQGSGIQKIVARTGGEEMIWEFARTENRQQFEEELMLTLEAEDLSGRQIALAVTDYAGNTAVLNETYYIDKQVPTVMLSGIMNGTIQKEACALTAACTDNIPEAVTLFYRVVKVVDGVEYQIEDAAEHMDRQKTLLSRSYAEEGSYRVTGYAEDLAGNRSIPFEVTFRIDPTPPRLSVGGVLNGTDYQAGQTLYVTVEEQFFADCSVEVTAKRRTPGYEEGVRLPSWNTRGKNSENSYSFDADGDYALFIRARDAAGNEASKEVWFRIDKTAPVLNIQGITEQSVTSMPPKLLFHMEEMFYDTAKIQSLLIRKGQNGAYVPLAVPEWKMGREQEDFLLEIKEEGMYELQVSAADRAGNNTRRQLRFTLDYTPPVIGYLDTLHEKYIKGFQLPGDFASKITDMTAVSYRAYLNTRNLLKEEQVTQDGKYILRVEAVDEAGNISEKTIAFIVDTTMPRVVISGMRKDGSAGKNEKLLLHLYEEEDRLEQVLLDGVEQKLSKDYREAELLFTEYGAHEIEVKAVDPAQNELTQVIHMKCALAASPFQGYEVIERTIAEPEMAQKGSSMKQFLQERQLPAIITAVAVAVVLGTAVMIRFLAFGTRHNV